MDIFLHSKLDSILFFDTPAQTVQNENPHSKCMETAQRTVHIKRIIFEKNRKEKL